MFKERGASTNVRVRYERDLPIDCQTNGESDD